MAESKKIAVSRRALEARIQRDLSKTNKKLKKKGDQYIVISLEKGGVDQIYDSLTELMNSMVILHEWEEIEEEGRADEFKGDVSMNDVAYFASSAALNMVISRLGAIGIIGDIQSNHCLAEDEIQEKVHNLILEFLKEIKKAGAHPKSINLVD